MKACNYYYNILLKYYKVDGVISLLQSILRKKYLINIDEMFLTPDVVIVLRSTICKSYQSQTN